MNVSLKMIVELYNYYFEGYLT